jgi:hypothetical protein
VLAAQFLEAARAKPGQTPETYSSGLHRAPLPGACARVFRDRDHLEQLCFWPPQAFPFLQAAGKWWSPTKPLAYSCWILIFLAALGAASGLSIRLRAYRNHAGLCRSCHRIHPDLIDLRPPPCGHIHGPQASLPRAVSCWRDTPMRVTPHSRSTRLFP